MDACDIIGDLAHEDPRIAEAVLAWRRRRTKSPSRHTALRQMVMPVSAAVLAGPWSSYATKAADMREYLNTRSSQPVEATELARWGHLRAMHPDAMLSITCRVGWLPLVARFLDEAQAALPTATRLTRVRAREKWGLLSLSYRVDPLTRETEIYGGLIAAAEKAESESARTCEVCGRPGSLRRSGGLHVTRCDKHYEANDADG
ncbi:MAG: hypothetical protein KF849_15325 [Rhizobiaceae bacterium]|nr:hypothetical protein [Rhizobiaceae bacterium]